MSVFFFICCLVLVKYIYCVVSAAEHKCLKRGVKEVVKSIRRGHKGSVCFLSNFFFLTKTLEMLTLIFRYCECRLCVIAGNISPIDVITHVPILCEESDIPYIYVPSKEVRYQLYIPYLYVYAYMCFCSCLPISL